METKFNPNDERREASSTNWPGQDDSRRYDWHQRISWGAVIAGTIIAIFIHLTLSLLGVGIGASTASGGNINGGSLATGSAIWYIVSMLISLFAGGWVAGRLAKDKHTSESMIHGLLVTGLMIILSFYLLSNAVGNVLGGVTYMLSNNLASVQQRYESGTGGDARAEQDRAELERKAERIAGQAAEGTAKGALYGFAGLLLSGIAGAMGAKMGRDSKDKYGNRDYKKRPISKL